MSGRKNVLLPYKMFAGADMSLPQLIAATDVPYVDNIGIFLKWTGNPTGTMAVQISPDKTNWADLPISPAISVAGAADTVVGSISLLEHCYLRLVYTSASGAGTLDGWISAKEV